VESVQHPQCLLGLVLGEQHPGQREVGGFFGVAGLVVRADATLGCPPCGRVHVAVGDQQPGPQRRSRVEPAGHRDAGSDPPGLLDGV
jgi:hypothetical protein